MFWEDGNSKTCSRVEVELCPWLADVLSLAPGFLQDLSLRVVPGTELQHGIYWITFKGGCTTTNHHHQHPHTLPHHTVTLSPMPTVWTSIGFPGAYVTGAAVAPGAASLSQRQGSPWSIHARPIPPATGAPWLEMSPQPALIGSRPGP